MIKHRLFALLATTILATTLYLIIFLNIKFQHQEIKIDTPFLTLSTSQISLSSDEGTFELREQEPNSTASISAMVKPGNYAYVPLDLQWQADGQTVQVNLYFGSDRKQWWVERAQSRVGSSEWTNYESTKEQTLTAVGKPMHAPNLILQNGSTQVSFENATITNYVFWPEPEITPYSMNVSYLQTVTLLNPGEFDSSIILLRDEHGKSVLDPENYILTWESDNQDVAQIVNDENNFLKTPCCTIEHQPVFPAQKRLVKAIASGRAVITVTAQRKNGEVVSRFSYPVYVR